MSKKTTLKHIVDGTVHTRTTARAYTHVCLARRNVEKTLASVEPLNLDKIAKEATYDWTYAQNIQKVPVGEKYFFHKNQGGAYLNKTGKHKEVYQYDHELAAEYHAEATVEEAVANAIAERQQRRAEWIEGVKSSSCEWQVVSWNGRQDLAEKEAARQSKTCDVRVEAINSGEAA